MPKIDTSTIEKFQNILAKDPQSQVFAPLADAYLEMDMIPEAETLTRNGIKRHPKMAGGHLVLGKILKLQGKHQDAITSLKKAIELAPNNILAHQTLGEIYFEEREAKEALRCFKMVLFLNPKSEKAKKIVQKLESVTADEFSDEAFEMTPLQNLKSNSETQLDEKTLVGHFDKTRILPPKSEVTNELQQDKALQRVLSLVDALIVRNELGKAQFMLQDCYSEFGNHPELTLRSKTLLMKSNPHHEVEVENPTSIRPIASREKQALERKLAVLQMVLRKIEEVKI